jgi:hypothetical protein
MLAQTPMRAHWSLAALVACAYRPGSFSAWGHEFAGQRATLGCLDVAIERRTDSVTGSVLAYDLANRCDHALVVNLHDVSVVAKTTDGEVAMIPYDPEHELRAKALDGRSVGAETIEYRLERDAQLLAVCVDTASLIVRATPRWECFGSGP